MGNMSIPVSIQSELPCLSIYPSQLLGTESMDALQIEREKIRRKLEEHLAFSCGMGK